MIFRDKKDEIEDFWSLMADFNIHPPEDPEAVDLNHLFKSYRLNRCVIAKYHLFVMNQELKDWFSDNQITYIVNYAYGKHITIPNEAHALLFKLTWL